MLRQEDFSRKDTERLATGLGVAMGVHILVFLIFSFVKWDSSVPQAGLSGPVYVTLNSTELDTKEKLSASKTESKPEMKAQQQEAPKKEITKTAPPTIKQTVNPPVIKQPDKPPVKSDAQKLDKIQRAETPVTQPEVQKQQVPQDSEKYATGEKKPITGEDADQQTPMSGILESDKLSQLEKVLNQGKEVNGYSGKTNNNRHGTSSSGTDTGTSSIDGVGPVQWEDPSQSARKIISRVNPDIPDWVGKQGITLKAIFSFAVTPEGYLTNIKLVKSSGYTDVDQAIATALAHYQFEPTSSTRLAKASVPYMIQPN